MIGFYDLKEQCKKLQIITLRMRLLYMISYGLEFKGGKYSTNEDGDDCDPVDARVVVACFYEDQKVDASLLSSHEAKHKKRLRKLP